MPKSTKDWVTQKITQILKPIRLPRISNFEIPRRQHFRTKIVKMTARQIAEAVLERRLKNTEYVHHIDENKGNDSLENLTLVSIRQYMLDTPGSS